MRRENWLLTDQPAGDTSLRAMSAVRRQLRWLIVFRRGKNQSYSILRREHTTAAAVSGAVLSITICVAAAMAK